MLRKLSILSILFFLVACKDTLLIEDCTTSQEFVCEQEYVFALSFTSTSSDFVHVGIYVDINGDVYEYSVDLPDDLPFGDTFTREQLDDLYTLKRSYLTTLGQAEFEEMKNLIASASAGEISVPEGFDAGIGEFSYIAYVYDADTDTYVEVTIYVTGDWTYGNLDAAAQTLKDWLIQTLNDWLIQLGIDYGL